MVTLDTAIIGAGPSGILAADKLLGTLAYDAVVTMYTKDRYIGGITQEYKEVQPNSPLKDLFTFVNELRAEKLFRPQFEDEILAEIDRAHEDPRLGQVAQVLGYIYNDILNPDPNFRLHPNHTVRKIREGDDGYFHLTLKNDWDEVYEQRHQSVISCIGGVPNKNPYEGVFRREMSMVEALGRRTWGFSDELVVVIGASHSGAIAVCNALEGKARKVEIWHRGDEPFLRHYVDEEQIKHYQFSGLNDPTKSRLDNALERYGDRVEFVNVEERKMGKVRTPFLRRKYANWLCVPAVGFSRPKIEFEDRDGNIGELTSVVAGEEFKSCAPNLCYPGTDTPIPRLYGLGLAYPLPFTEGFLPNTVEKEGAGVVGIYFTNELSKAIVPDVLKSALADERLNL